MGTPHHPSKCEAQGKRMNWLYKLLGFKKYRIYEADDGSFVIAENPEGFRSGDEIWVKN